MFPRSAEPAVQKDSQPRDGAHLQHAAAAHDVPFIMASPLEKLLAKSSNPAALALQNQKRVSLLQATSRLRAASNAHRRKESSLVQMQHTQQVEDTSHAITVINLNYYFAFYG